LLTVGLFLFQVLCNALWAITNFHERINAAALHKASVKPVPVVFEQYKNLNDLKKRKQKQQPLTQIELEGHSQALYNLLVRPLAGSSGGWKSFTAEIKELVNCIDGYKVYLKDQASISEKNRLKLAPVRSIGENATVEHRTAYHNLIGSRAQYLKLDEVVKRAGLNTPVMFEESMLNTPFENSMQRYRFFANLSLSVPVDIIRFCPGGSLTTTIVITQVAADRTEAQKLIMGAQLLQRVKPLLKEIHTQAQRREFQNELNNLARFHQA
jgi:hypothetical protein